MTLSVFPFFVLDSPLDGDWVADFKSLVCKVGRSTPQLDSVPGGFNVTSVIGVGSPIGCDAKGADGVPTFGGGELGVCAQVS